MKKLLKRLLLIVPLSFVIILLIYTYHPRVYVLDMGGSTERVVCGSFVYQPLEYTVVCDTLTFAGVRSVSVK